MIKKWTKFNESTSEIFTEEMAQEILYFFSEDSIVPKSIETDFNRIYKDYQLNQIVFYETSNDEMKEFIKYLFDKSKEDENLKRELIELYYKIREKMKIFPKVCEIEDVYLNIIEDLNYKFYLSVNSGRKSIKIKLLKWSSISLDDFIQTCKIINGTLMRLKGDEYSSKLESCEYSSQHSEFKIELKGK